MHKQKGWPQACEYYQAKPIQTLGRASQGVDWTWSESIKSHHTQTSSGKGLPSHFWNRNNVRNIVTRLRRKRTGLLLSGPKSSFQIKVNVAFNLEIKIWTLLISFSSRTLAPAHCAKITSKWFADLDITVLDWPANMPDLNTYEIYGIFSGERWETVDPTIQTSWRLNCASEMPQTQCFHATPHWCCHLC